MKCLLIINPRSGQQKIRNKAIDVIETFNRAGWTVTTAITLKSRDIDRIVTENESFDIAVCCGGDGTLNEMCDALYRHEKQCLVGYIPCGTTNDFANSLGIPLDIKKAAEAIVKGSVQQRDLGLFNDRVFVYTASFGLFAEASINAPQEAKNTFGSIAYLIEGLKDITNVKGYKAKITIDDEVVEDSFIYGGISNSTSIGGILHFDEADVDYNDGKLEVFLIHNPKNILELNDIIINLLNGTFNSKYITLKHAEKITIESESNIIYTLDGEYGDSIQNVTIDVLKSGLSHCFKR